MMAATVIRPAWPLAVKVAQPTAPLAASVRTATIRDVYAITDRMRTADAAEATALGRNPRQALRLSFKSSLTAPRVAVLGDVPIAMWGLGGPILADVGTPWLVTTPEVERFPVTFIRIARQEIRFMLARRPVLENVVAADYRGAVRLLEVLGFRLGEPVPMGPKEALFRTFSLGRD